MFRSSSTSVEQSGLPSCPRTTEDEAVDQVFSALLPQARTADRRQVAAVISQFPLGVLRLTAEQGVTIRTLQERERYDDASAALRGLGVDVDAWPAPPAGLFVVEERCVYLRSKSRMTIAHEYAHAIDCALGGGVYLSTTDAEIRAAFSVARAFVTPYAATGCDEYFAESLRAFAGDFNDPDSFWPRATRERLLCVDPGMHAICKRIFERFG